MTFFIIEAAYDQCFEWFFKDECGYPNFYRLNELMPTQDDYNTLIVLAPDPKLDPPHLHQISQRMTEKKIRCLSFGEQVSTQFSFEPTGKLRTHPQFQAELDKALQAFLAPPKAS